MADNGTHSTGDGTQASGDTTTAAPAMKTKVGGGSGGSMIASTRKEGFEAARKTFMMMEENKRETLQVGPKPKLNSSLDSSRSRAFSNPPPPSLSKDVRATMAPPMHTPTHPSTHTSTQLPNQTQQMQPQ